MAEPTQVSFGSGSGRVELQLAPTVHTRASWSDPWTLQPHLWPAEVNWQAAPALPTATLRWLYGRRSTPAQVGFVDTLKLSGMARAWVKIRIPTVDFSDGDGSLIYLEWVGFIDLSADKPGGLRIETAGDGTKSAAIAGEQTFVAYGPEKLLSLPIDRGYVRYLDGLALKVARFDEPPAFNAGGRPNMSPTDHVSPLTGEATPVFEADPTVAQLWSTRDIVRYLLAWCGPTDESGLVAAVQFTASETPSAVSANVELPSHDAPANVEQRQQTIYSLLSRLLDRRRLYLWYFDHLTLEDSDGEVITESFDLVLNTLLREPLTLGLAADPDDNPTIPANPYSVHLLYDQDQGTRASLKSSTVPVVDQVVAQGARRVSIGSFSIKDADIGAAWEPAKTAAYNAASSADADYAGLGMQERERRNKDRREGVELEEVFRRWAIPAAFDFTVGDGVGGLVGAARNPLFPTDFDPIALVRPYFGSMHIQADLTPLLVGVDYSGSKVGDGSFDETDAGDDPQPIRPFWLFRTPESAPAGSVAADWRWVRSDEVSRNADSEVTIEKDADDFRRWSASLSVVPDSQEVRLQVVGAPRHVIDGETLFSPLLDAAGKREDKVLGGWDIHEGAILTIGVLDSRRAEGRSPPDDELASVDVVRRRFIDAGDDYRRDYVAPQTVVGVDAEGKLIRSDGGFIPPTGPTDDVARLTAMADIAAAWYTRVHQVLTLTSFQVRAREEVGLGDLVAVIGEDVEPLAGADHHEVIDSPITSIQVRLPWGEPGTQAPPTWTIRTWAGELDAFQVSPAPLVLRDEAARAAAGRVAAGGDSTSPQVAR